MFLKKLTIFISHKTEIKVTLWLCLEDFIDYICANDIIYS